MRHRRRQRSLGRGLAALALALTTTFAIALCACGSTEETYVDPGQASAELEDRVSSGLSMRAQRGSDTLEIRRGGLTGKRPNDIEKDTWTVFVYLCGSDLETNGGAATRDLAEMVGASGSENVQFVVETGGSKQWQSNVGGKRICRYMIQDGAITEVEALKNADMGDPATLADFLSWGIKNYPAEHMGVILWDHGGGSITGVCFDENNKYDSLILRELDLALSQVAIKMWQKFDFIGFDACLMGTLETANVCATYADYMYASQEVEPGTGWEYSSIMEYLATHPSADGAELGRAISDAYKSSVNPRQGGTVTLSVTDLSQIDTLLQDFYAFSQEMYEAGSDSATLAAMTRAIQGADRFGSNNWAEGYTNMVDLGGIVTACSAVTPSAKDVQASLGRAVPYKVSGRTHARSSGLSVYYPLSTGNANELTRFQSIAANPSYLSYVDRMAHGATFAGTQDQSAYTSYSSEPLFDEEGLWDLMSVGLELLVTYNSRSVNPYWSYVDQHSFQSKVVTFAEEPQVDDEGVYWFQLDRAGIDNVASAFGIVSAKADGGERTLGETPDVYADWDEGIVEDGFDGRWLSLPDGQPLCLYVVEATQDDFVFTSPVTVNGKRCFLRMAQEAESGDVTVEGVFDGVGEGGSSARVRELEAGDVVVPLYTELPDGTKAPGELDVTAEGEALTVGEAGLEVTYGELPLGAYSYGFSIRDVFGDTYQAPSVTLEIEEDGIYLSE